MIVGKSWQLDGMNRVVVSCVVGFLWLGAGILSYESMISSFQPLPERVALVTRDTYANDADGDGLELGVEETELLVMRERLARRRV